MLTPLLFGSSDLFVDPADLNVVPQLFMMAVYGYILFVASNIISDGSEMLLGIYGPGIVGGLVIPILGAVPDSAIILVSGLGPKDEAQEQLNVGVGTLAGSTIMLLTIPWAIGTFLGRRDIENGEAATIEVNGKLKPKLTKGRSWTETGVTTAKNVTVFAKVMIISSVSYLIIQIPAFFDNSSDDASKKERPFALVGFIVTGLGFIGYSVYQLYDAKHDEYLRALQREAERNQWKASLQHKIGHLNSFEKVFNEFDKDHNGVLDRVELAEALRMLGLNVDRQEVNHILADMDLDKSGTVDLEEFTNVILMWIDHHSDTSVTARRTGTYNPDSRQVEVELDTQVRDEEKQALQEPLLQSKGSGGIQDQDDEEEEEEEEYLELTDAELKTKAFSMLLFGTLLVVIFSDPMVDVIGAFGKRIPGNGPFYVSFIVTPIASNASEIISAMVFAKKKTNKGMSLTFSSLYGAATMNNTLGLCIFMALVYFRQLTWSFSAEVISIIVVTLVVGINGCCQTVKLWQAAVVLAMYPFSLLLVGVLENAAGLD